jgi:hypothetical protein
MDIEDGEIVELDFEDTSALSNPDVFSRQRRGGANGSVVNGRLKNGTGSVQHQKDGGVIVGSGPENNGGAGGRMRRTNGKNKKPGKAERIAERAKRMQELENSWDFPDGSGLSDSRQQSSPPATPSPVASPVLSHVAVGEAMAPNNIRHAAKKDKVRQPEPALSRDIAREVLLGAVLARAGRQPLVDKNEFVRELLALIHVS